MGQAILPLVDWIKQNRTGWVFLMEEEETTTQFTYNMSWIVSAYMNACILESTAAVERDPGARILVSFQYLIDELDHGWYTGRALPRSLQDLFYRPCGTTRGAGIGVRTSPACTPDHRRGRKRRRRQRRRGDRTERAAPE